MHVLRLRMNNFYFQTFFIMFLEVYILGQLENINMPKLLIYFIL